MEECWGGGTATFMLMGDTCTRACKFCAVKTGNPHGLLDQDEPKKVGEAILKMKLKYVVITSVDRDDLPDQGANHFGKTIETVKQGNPNLIVEILAPDFQAKKELIERVVNSGPDVFAHNVETVRTMTPKVRDRRSSYDQSLRTLEIIKEIKKDQYTKSSIMLGMGEKLTEVFDTMRDLRSVGVDVLTLGQYLSPGARYHPVTEYINPDIFKEMEEEALSMGFLYVASGPLVRSSYRAGEFFMEGIIKKRQAGENI